MVDLDVSLEVDHVDTGSYLRSVPKGGTPPRRVFATRRGRRCPPKRGGLVCPCSVTRVAGLGGPEVERSRVGRPGRTPVSGGASSPYTIGLDGDSGAVDLFPSWKDRNPTLTPTKTMLLVLGVRQALIEVPSPRQRFSTRGRRLETVPVLHR